MSEHVNRLKVSQGGLELIKSFEGLRMRAERLEDGRWVIGHGHTRSAREGAEVSAEEAELLLLYDLTPVLEVIRTWVAAPLNQHQIDALASFALDVGIEGFLSSDVLARLNTGAPDDAAHALATAEIPSTGPTPPDPAARRRAAEGALFRHDPAAEADLAVLLTVPAAPDSEAAPEVEPEAEPGVVPEAATDAPSEPEVDFAPASDDPIEPGDARAQALAVLLGEASSIEAPELSDAEVLPSVEAPTSQKPEAEVQDSGISAPEILVPVFAPRAPEAVEPEAAEPEAAVPEAVAPEASASGKPANDHDDSLQVEGAPASPSSSALIDMRRYGSYGATLLGPITGLASEDDPAGPSETNVDAGAVEPELVSEVSSEPDQAAISDPAAPVGEDVLVLTPPPEVETEPPTRLVWPEATREDGGVDVEPLFIEDPAARAGAVSVFMPEPFDAGPRRRFDWNETGAFVGMGAVGLTAFGASLIGFRIAASQSGPPGLDETTAASATLAVIGALCVGVSAYNLYRLRGRSRGE